MGPARGSTPLDTLLDLSPAQKRAVAVRGREPRQLSRRQQLRLSLPRPPAMQALVLGSGAAAGKLLQSACRAARREQQVRAAAGLAAALCSAASLRRRLRLIPPAVHWCACELPCTPPRPLPARPSAAGWRRSAAWRTTPRWRWMRALRAAWAPSCACEEREGHALHLLPRFAGPGECGSAAAGCRLACRAAAAPPNRPLPPALPCGPWAPVQLRARPLQRGGGADLRPGRAAGGALAAH